MLLIIIIIIIIVVVVIVIITYWLSGRADIWLQVMTSKPSAATAKVHAQTYYGIHEYVRKEIKLKESTFNAQRDL